MLNIGQLKRFQGLEKPGRQVVAMSNSPVLTMFFNQMHLKKPQFYIVRIFGYVKKHKLLITLLITVHWVKPGRPAELIFLTSTSLIGTLRATPAEAASYRIEILYLGHRKYLQYFDFVANNLQLMPSILHVPKV